MIKNEVSEKLQDLISGIGDKREKRLNEIGIFTVEDLANQSAEVVTRFFKSSGDNVSIDQIEIWISEAQTLISENSSANMLKSSPSEWKQLGMSYLEFHVRQRLSGELEYRFTATRARDGKPKEFSSINDPQLVDWMFGEQLAEHAQKVKSDEVDLPEVIESKPTPKKFVNASKVELEIGQINAYQPPSSTIPMGYDRNKTFFDRPIKANELFVFEVHYNVDGKTELGEITNPANMTAQIFAHDRSTGERIVLEDENYQFRSLSQSHHVISLHDLSLPKGIYRLQVLIGASENPGIMGFIEIPIFQVL